jgi:hypothetical protein
LLGQPDAKGLTYDATALDVRRVPRHQREVVGDRRRRQEAVDDRYGVGTDSSVRIAPRQQLDAASQLTDDENGQPELVLPRPDC